MENLNTGTRVHKITANNRATCTISGVNDVLSFDEHEVLLQTSMGMLCIKGKDLHVNRLTLDKGEIDVDGNLDSFVYSDTGTGGQKSESLMSRLFR
jgi:sporulation protein YabP